MESKTNKQFVEPLLKTLRTFQGNSRCLYPGCSNKPIRSHIIAESILEKIADSEAKVMAWNPSPNEIVAHVVQGHKWEQVYEKPIRVGIRQGTTYPIFCNEHDNDIFAELEDHGFSFGRRHVALLAYRALCYQTWNPNLEQMSEFLLSNKDADTKLQHERIFSIEPMIAARQKFENMLATEDYRELCWISRIIHVVPFLVCTDATIPYEGEEDAKNIANGCVTLTPEDVITFSLFPERKRNASICVITWFRNNSRGMKVINDLEWETLPEKDIIDDIIFKALGRTLVYMSPTWWYSLTPEQQDDIWKIRLSINEFLPDI